MRQTRRRKKRPMCRWRTGDCLDETGKKAKRCFPWFRMVATVEDAPGLAPGNPHGHPFRNDCPDDVPDCCSLQVGKQGSLDRGIPAGPFPCPRRPGDVCVARDRDPFSVTRPVSGVSPCVGPPWRRGVPRGAGPGGALLRRRSLERPGAFRGSSRRIAGPVPRGSVW